MALLLPPDLDARAHEKMHSAGYLSPEDVIREALNALDAQERVQSPLSADEHKPAALPIWEQFAQAGLALPEKVLAALPSDGASEHDHYIYGTPKHME